MIKRPIVAFLLAQCIFLSLAGVAAQNRTALLVANGNYTNFGKLANPVPEARALKAALERLGFSVSLVENASREAMVDALADFEAALRSRGGIAFFHYGGHGVQVGGKNYLLPANAEIPDEKRVASRSVDLDEVMATLEAGGSETNIVVLDACRNNPLPATSGRSATRGLAVLGTKPRNSIIIYAAESGSVAQDGLFTPALTKAIATPGLDLSQVVMQVRREVYDASRGTQTPGAYDQLFSPVYLAGRGTVSAAAAPPATASPPATAAPPSAAPTLTVTRSYGSLVITAATAGSLYLDGVAMGELPAGAEARLDSVEVGERSVELRYAGGERETKLATVQKGQAASVGFSWRKAASPAPAATASSSPKSYRIGDTGPAGGWIFYDKGFVSDGWRYLEAAPSDQSASIQWYNGSNRNIKTGTAVGTGKANTAAIIAAQGAGSYAASLCKNLMIKGFSDWFLPSMDELNLMYTNLKKKGLGGLGEGWLWSSSQYNNGVDARVQSFSDGSQGYVDKSGRYSVRAVRAF